jgi:hypothetical protein
MNSIYDLARVQLLTKQFDWPTMPLVLSVWTGTPTFVATDEHISDIMAHGATELGYSMPITQQTVFHNGTAQTNRVIVPAVPIGPMVTWFTMSKKHATVHTESQPILFIDDAEGLPFDPNGLDMAIEPDWLQSRGWFRP